MTGSWGAVRLDPNGRGLDAFATWPRGNSNRACRFWFGPVGRDPFLPRPNMTGRGTLRVLETNRSLPFRNRSWGLIRWIREPGGPLFEGTARSCAMDLGSRVGSARCPSLASRRLPSVRRPSANSQESSSSGTGTNAGRYARTLPPPQSSDSTASVRSQVLTLKRRDYEARDIGPRGEGQNQREEGRARAKDGVDEKQEENAGQGNEEIDDTHQEAIDRPAGEAAQKAVESTDDHAAQR